MAAENEINLSVISETRTKAFNLSDTDKIGGVIQKSMDVLLELTRDNKNMEVNPERLKTAVSSLKSERELVEEYDEEKDDELRKGIYALMVAFENTFEWYADREEKLIKAANVKKEKIKEEGEADGKSLCEVSESGVGSAPGATIKLEDDDDALTVKMEVVTGDDKAALKKIVGKTKEEMRAAEKAKPKAKAGTKNIKEEKIDDDEAETSKAKGAKRTGDEEAAKKTPKRARKSAGDKEKTGEDEETEEPAKTPKGSAKKTKPEPATPKGKSKENDEVSSAKKSTTQKSVKDFFKAKN